MSNIELFLLTKLTQGTILEVFKQPGKSWHIYCLTQNHFISADVTLPRPPGCAAREHICGQSCSVKGTPCTGAHHTLKIIPVWYFLTQLLFSCHLEGWALNPNIWQYWIQNKFTLIVAWNRTATINLWGQRSDSKVSRRDAEICIFVLVVVLEKK